MSDSCGISGTYSTGDKLQSQNVGVLEVQHKVHAVRQEHSHGGDDRTVKLDGVAVDLEAEKILSLYKVLAPDHVLAIHGATGIASSDKAKEEPSLTGECNASARDGLNKSAIKSVSADCLPTDNPKSQYAFHHSAQNYRNMGKLI